MLRRMYAQDNDTRSSGLALCLDVYGCTRCVYSCTRTESSDRPTKAAGKLRVDVLNNLPVLVENVSSNGEAWNGPAWLIAKEVATELHVSIEAVRVSNETEVPILNSDGVDITITNLSPTPQRSRVIDFVDYSREGQCLYGRAANRKLHM